MNQLDRDPATGWMLLVPGAVVTQLYGPDNTSPEVQHLYRKGYHTGIDFGGVPAGTPVLSPAEGTVTIAGTNAGYGECVVLRRDDGTEVIFGHLSRVAVSVGQRVGVGQEIGGIGETGVSTGVHLHFECRRNGDDVDPTPLLDGNGAARAAATAPAGPRATVTGGDINLRAAPDDTATILTTVPAGTAVTLRRQSWFPVWWNGREGWMWGEYLRVEGEGVAPELGETLPASPEPATEPPPAPCTGRTTANPNLRAGPGTEHPVLAVLQRGTPLQVLAEQGEWLRVNVAGREGYLHRSLVALDDQPIAPRTGRTIGNPNLRGGPGAEHPVLTVLRPGMALEVLDEQFDYLHVRVDGQEGFVHRDFVRLGDRDVPEGFLRARSELANVPLEAPRGQQIDLSAVSGDDERLVGDTWNRYGGLLTVLSNELGIDPAVAVAVLAVEAGGQGFGPGGKMIIRFENHIFYDQWGQYNPDTFFQYFAFSPHQSWQDHLWRPSPEQPWQSFHGNQVTEWQVFEFARGLDDTAAKRSISMGAPQIMGFNCTAIGCESPQEMFDSFCRSERDQVIGFFDFVGGGTTDSARLQALQRQDFLTFAVLYNGTGQAPTYAALIRGKFDALHRVRP